MPTEVCQIERIFGLTLWAFGANVTDAVRVDFYSDFTIRYGKENKEYTIKLQPYNDLRRLWLYPTESGSSNRLTIEKTGKNEYVANGQNYYGVYFQFANNIKLSASWKPIGATKDGSGNGLYGRNIWPFSGTLDGNGHALSQHL